MEPVSPPAICIISNTSTATIKFQESVNPSPTSKPKPKTPSLLPSTNRNEKVTSGFSLSKFPTQKKTRDLHINPLLLAVENSPQNKPKTYAFLPNSDKHQTVPNQISEFFSSLISQNLAQNPETNYAEAN